MLLLHRGAERFEWMRFNPLVCVQVEEIRAHDEWMSVVIFGKYVEIPNGREFAKSRRIFEPSCRRDPCGGRADRRHPRFAGSPSPAVSVFFYIGIEEIPDFVRLPTPKRTRFVACRLPLKNRS